MSLDRALDLDLSRAWLVDPGRDRQGPGEVVVRRGRVRSIRWLRGPEARGVDDRGIVVAPSFVDLHAHVREPGNEAAESVRSLIEAAAHGGFGTACVMPNTEPPIDGRAAVDRLELAAARAFGDDRGAPPRVTLRPWGAVTAGRRGEQLADLAELGAGGVVGFSDDGAPIRSAVILRSALAYAGALGLPVMDHPEDPSLTHGAEAGEGLVATVLGLEGWPVAAEVSAVARDLAILEDVVRDVPAARLHLTHLSTGRALDLVRDARRRGLPVTCDVTPHHLALADEWLAGARRWAWEAVDAEGRRRDPWLDGALEAEPYDTALRVNPPLRSPEDALACLRAVADGTADAVATDHAPHAAVDKAVEFGLAPSGISGIETALGVLLAAVDAGHLALDRAIAALTVGPARVLVRPGHIPTGPAAGDAPSPSLQPRELADLVVFDRSEAWTVSGASLRSRGLNSPLLGRRLPGRVLLTVHRGSVAFQAEEIAAS